MSVQFILQFQQQCELKHVKHRENCSYSDDNSKNNIFYIKHLHETLFPPRQIQCYTAYEWSVEALKHIIWSLKVPNVSCMRKCTVHPPPHTHTQLNIVSTVTIQSRAAWRVLLTRRVSNSAGSGLGDLTKGMTTGDLTASCWGFWGLGRPNAVIG